MNFACFFVWDCWSTLKVMLSYLGMFVVGTWIANIDSLVNASWNYPSVSFWPPMGNYSLPKSNCFRSPGSYGRCFNILVWVFPKIGIPQNGWFIMENPIKMDDLGYPYFRKHPYVLNFQGLYFWSAFLFFLPCPVGFTHLFSGAMFPELVLQLYVIRHSTCKPYVFSK